MSIGIAISSCKRYYENNVPRLIQEINNIFRGLDATIPVLIVAGGYSGDSTTEQIDENIVVAKVPYQAFDLTSAYYIAENNYLLDKVTHWFISHDTVQFSLQFINILATRKSLTECDTTRLGYNGYRYSMNMGVYSTAHLCRSREKMVPLLVYDDAKLQDGKRLAIDTEDFLFLEGSPFISKYQITSNNIICIDGVILNKLCFIDIDFIKFQQNFNRDQMSFKSLSCPFFES